MPGCPINQGDCLSGRWHIPCPSCFLILLHLHVRVSSSDLCKYSKYHKLDYSHRHLYLRVLEAKKSKVKNAWQVHFCEGPFWLVYVSLSSQGWEEAPVSLPLIKDTNPSWGSHSWSHPNLIISQRLHLQIPSGMRLWTDELGADGQGHKLSVSNREALPCWFKAAIELVGQGLGGRPPLQVWDHAHTGPTSHFEALSWPSFPKPLIPLLKSTYFCLACFFGLVISHAPSWNIMSITGDVMRTAADVDSVCLLCQRFACIIYNGFTTHLWGRYYLQVLFYKWENRSLERLSSIFTRLIC